MLINYKSNFVLSIVLVAVLFLTFFINGLCSSKYTFNLAGVSDSWGEGGVGTRIFAQSVRAATNGDIDITLHLDGTWGGDELEYMQSIEMNTLDMANISLTIVGQIVESLNLWDIPFMFKSLNDEINTIFISERELTPLAEKLINQANEEANFVILAMSPVGRRDILSAVPINSLDDLKGLKIRTVASDIQVDTFNMMGAISTPLPYGECYSALQLKNLDAMENSPSVYMRQRFFEVAPYWFGTSHYTCVHILVVSKKAWDSIPEAYQRILKSCAIGASYFQSLWSVGSNDNLLSGQIQKVAEKMVYLTDKEHEELRSMVLPKLIDKYGKEISIDALRELAKQDVVLQKYIDSKE